eukprot:2568917-Pleurochrysis_carterae.AAC.1
MSPRGRAPLGVAPLAAASCASRGSALRALERARSPSRATGCGARKSPGSGSSASRSSCSGSRFREDAKGAGVARAVATASRTPPARPAPSASRPPPSAGTVCSSATPGSTASALAPPPPSAPTSASASASFIPSGYAAACAASAIPAWSLPYATSGWAPAPCVHRASRSRPRDGVSERACARVVYFRARAPSAHCAKVTVCASALRIASRTRGSSHSGAWSAMRGHHAGPPASPQSAGFSTAQRTPAACAASTRSAAKHARRLCFA